MKKGLKVLLSIFLIVVVVLIVNEFVMFPISSGGGSPMCAQASLEGLVDNGEIILTGTAGGSRWVTADPSRGIIETYTEIDVDNIIKGSYNEDEITVRRTGGCSVRWNYCLWVEDSAVLVEGKKYLLFLSQPNDENVYDGFSGCGGVYWIVLDNSGNENVYCFADDIDNCIEKEVVCPSAGDGFGGYAEDGTPSLPSTCIEEYVLLEDLIRQIQELGVG
jgi:hypothetical protein